MSPNSTKTEKVRISNSGDAPLVISRIWTNNPNFSATRETSIVEFGDSANLAVKFNQDSVKGLKKGLVFIEHKGANRRERAWIGAILWWYISSILPPRWIRFRSPQILRSPIPYSCRNCHTFPSSPISERWRINQVSHKDTLVVFKNTGNDTVRGPFRWSWWSERDSR